MLINVNCDVAVAGNIVTKHVFNLLHNQCNVDCEITLRVEVLVVDYKV